MARPLRIEYEGAIYHVMSRGNRGDEIMRDDADRERFLATLAEAATKCGWEVHAWCLMGNHFHLVVETPQGNLVAGMKWLLGTYTLRFNRRHRVQGHLFGGRYKALPVDDAEPHYLRVVVDYVHLNPSKAGFMEAGAPLSAYRWSSYGTYLLPPAERPEWLRVDRVFGEHGIRRDDARGRERFAMEMEALRTAPQGMGEGEALGNTWPIGGEGFRTRLLERLSEKPTVSDPVDAPLHRTLKESMEARARRLLAEELHTAGWKEADLLQTKKNDPVKVKAAIRLRRETTVPLRWIAEALQMGTWNYVAHLLQRADEMTKIVKNKD